MASAKFRLWHYNNIENKQLYYHFIAKKYHNCIHINVWMGHADFFHSILHCLPNRIHLLGTHVHTSFFVVARRRKNIQQIICWHCNNVATWKTANVLHTCLFSLIFGCFLYVCMRMAWTWCGFRCDSGPSWNPSAPKINCFYWIYSINYLSVVCVLRF